MRYILSLAYLSDLHNIKPIVYKLDLDLGLKYTPTIKMLVKNKSIVSSRAGMYKFLYRL